MTTTPPKEYIITLDEIDTLIHANVELCLLTKRDILSRPAPSPQCPHQIVARVSYPDGDKNEWVCNNPLTEARKAATRKQERERVLDELVKKIREKPAYFVGTDEQWRIGNIITEMRGKP